MRIVDEPTAEQLARVPMLPGDSPQMRPTGQPKRLNEYDVPVDHVHPCCAASVPSEEQLQESCLHIRPNPLAIGFSNQKINGSSDPQCSVSYNTGEWVPIESDIMTGRIFIAIRGLPGEDKELFAGKKRLLHVVTQARYKRPLKASSLCNGQEMLKKPPEHMSKLVETILDTLLRFSTRRFASTAMVSASHGYMFNPALPMCQLIQVSRLGEEPQQPMDTVEDLTLWEPSLVDAQGRPLDSEKRRKWADNPKNLEGLVIGTEHVWTWHSWQHFMDFSSLRMHFGLGLSADIAPVLYKQPLQMTTKDLSTGEYIFSLLIWHRRLLQHDSAAHEGTLVSIGKKLSLFQKGVRGFLGSKPA